MTSPLGMSLAQASAALARREISALELVDAAILRAGQINPALNAFVRIDAQAARSLASDSDHTRATGTPRSALEGIPMAHKDMFHRAGIANSCGARVRQPLPQSTATVLRQLDAAGAVQFGVLHMAEFAFGPTGHNWSIGHCRNPWNPARITGGSSSGPAAAVAARACFAALGSDTGASIRLPASMNGITGLKTSYGRVSRAAAMPLSFSLDTVGPLARSAYDCAMVLQAIAGHDPSDPTSSRAAVPDYLRHIGDSVRGLRVGVPTRYFTQGVDAAIDLRMQASLDVLRGLGCVLVPVDPGDMAAANTAGILVTAAEAAAQHAALLRSQGDLYARQVRIRVERGYAISAPQYLDALRYRGLALAAFTEAVFSRVDVLHAPVVPVPTPDILATDIQDGPALDPLLGDLTRFLRPINYLGLPALALPGGFLDDGMPVGFQLIGRPFREDQLLQLGHAYQSATDWHHRAPPENFNP
jgi:aspartyl-tRNA(Asn)/glutamyl-tRNA(Gln) amidotransferase subunit A